MKIQLITNFTSVSRAVAKHTTSSTEPIFKVYKAELMALLSQGEPRSAIPLPTQGSELTPSLSRAVAMTQEVFSRPPKPQPGDGLNPPAREALGVIRMIAARGGILDALSVADGMQVSVSAITGALVELERKRLIHPGDWESQKTNHQEPDSAVAEALQNQAGDKKGQF